MSDKKIAQKYSEGMAILGLRVHQAGVKEVHAYIEGVIQRNEKAIVINLNAHALSLALRLPWMHAFINRAHLVFCDGDGVRLGLKLLGDSPPPKTPTTRWIWELAQFCAEKKYRVFFPGRARRCCARSCDKAEGKKS